MTRNSRRRSRSGVRQGNAAKYASYALAFGWMKRALAHRFYLEAVTIAESVICDRLISRLSRLGALDPDVPVERLGLGRLITVWRKAVPGRISDRFFDDVQATTDDWRRQRNHVLHGIVKTPPGRTPSDAALFKREVEAVARLGHRLAKSVCNWDTRERRKRRRRAPETLVMNDAVNRAPNQPLHRAGARVARSAR
jgi:hypothetical protein